MPIGTRSQPWVKCGRMALGEPQHGPRACLRGDVIHLLRAAQNSSQLVSPLDKQRSSSQGTVIR